MGGWHQLLSVSHTMRGGSSLDLEQPHNPHHKYNQNEPNWHPKYSAVQNPRPFATGLLFEWLSVESPPSDCGVPPDGVPSSPAAEGSLAAVEGGGGCFGRTGGFLVNGARNSMSGGAATVAPFEIIVLPTWRHSLREPREPTRRKLDLAHRRQFYIEMHEKILDARQFA